VYTYRKSSSLRISGLELHPYRSCRKKQKRCNINVTTAQYLHIEMNKVTAILDL
jgi:hypothetical protein